MLVVELALKLTQVILTAAIASIPLLYPRHSLFIRRASAGIEKLADWDHEDEGLFTSELTRDDKGFKQVKQAIQAHSPLVEGSVDSVGIMWATTPEKRIEIVQTMSEDIHLTVGPNGVIYARSDGEYQPLFYERWGSMNVKRLSPLKAAVNRHAQNRAHASTVLLTGVWTLVAIILIT